MRVCCFGNGRGALGIGPSLGLLASVVGFAGWFSTSVAVVPAAAQECSPLEASADRNGDGVPDDCPQGSFCFSFRGPSCVLGAPGELVRFTATAQLSMPGFAPEELGASGWSVLVAAEGATVRNGRVDGTVVTEGDRFFFHRTQIAAQGTCEGVLVSSVLLNLQEPFYLEPQSSPHDVLHVDLEAQVPATGGREVRLHILDACCASETCPQPAGGAGGSLFGLLESEVYQGAESFRPFGVDAVIRMSAAVPFHRGDANDDGGLDLSDAVSVFRYLFSGARSLGCLDAADADDDNLLSLTDGIFILRYLFLFTEPLPPPPPAPGPPGEPCGVDVGSERLGCEAYHGCA